MNLFEHSISIKKIKALLGEPSLEFLFAEAWASSRPNHRALMRMALGERLLDVGVRFDRERLMDLSSIPHLDQYFASLSHSPEAGMIAMAKCPVGIDLESSSRIQSATVKRISNSTEFTKAPNPAALWVAKEATFKALHSFKQPSAMSHLETGNWRALDMSLSIFELINNQKFDAPPGHGVVIQNNDLAIAIFLFQP